ncbi:uncharacterized protein LOC116261748 [Nymphaea colorata]|nr:uncharacterized protein LOC116261748 [Nymphaea colorata]
MSTRDVGGKERWGTWEELVLACAVKRHGTKSWDFVAMEVQTRTSSPSRFLLSADDCRAKYRDLWRRFRNGKARKEDEGEEEGEGVEEGHEAGEEKERRIPWLEELRKIRVDELRREVERYDVSIVSLQHKLNKLKEDRERSVSEAENGQKDLDPVKEENREQLLRSEGEAADRKADGEKEAEGGTIKGIDPETKPSEPNQRNDESDRENRSFSESNSTEEKPQARAPEPEMTDGVQDRTADPAGEGTRGERPAGRPPSPSESYNGSSETIGKDPAGRQSLREGREADLGDVYSATKDATGGEIGGAGRSNAESKDGSGEVEDAKESSEELSSVRLSKKRRRKGLEKSSSGDDDERASDGVSTGDSPRMKRSRAVAGEVGRLAEPLDAVRSHRYGRVFERRLDSQDTMYYRSLIRKHVDLEAVSTRVEEGHYSSPLEFFRDLLLLFNNALVFYPKNSPESTAAGHLRDLVTRELMAPNKAQKAENMSDPSPSSDTKEQPRSGSNNPVSQPSKSGNSVAPVVVSRKRSTLSASQPEAAKQPNVETESVTREEPDGPGSREGKGGAENESKKRPLKGSRTNKSRASMMATKNAPNSSSHQNASQSSNHGRSLTASTTTASKGVLNVTVGEKAELPSKKRSAAAANFLNRMKRASGGPTTTTSAAMTSAGTNLLETLRESGGGNGGRGGDQRKGGRDGRKEPGSRQTGGRQNAPASAPPKRGVGRPPKKGVAGRQRAKEAEAQPAPPPPPPSRTVRKRARR